MLRASEKSRALKNQHLKNHSLKNGEWIIFFLTGDLAEIITCFFNW